MQRLYRSVRRPAAVAIMVVVFAVASGCSILPSPGEPGPRTVTSPVVEIREVVALYENVAPSFWHGSSARRNYRLFLNVWIELDLNRDAAEQVRDVRLHDPFGSHWPIPFDRARLGEQGTVGGWLRLYDTFMSDNGSMLPLRGMTLQVELADGTIVSRTVDVPPPASTTSDERFLVTEEYRGDLTGDHVFAIERVPIRDASVRSGTLRVVFGPVDPRATNGRLVLLDEARELVGESPSFYNEISREPRAFLNDGTRFRSDEENVVDIAIGQVEWADGRSAADAVAVYVVLRDGAQFAFTARSGAYTHLSRSAPFALTTSSSGSADRQ